jgi:hypothetical protein
MCEPLLTNKQGYILATLNAVTSYLGMAQQCGTATMTS